MAMADLAKFGGETPVSLVTISKRQQISLAYLEQIFGQLRRSGLVESARGRSGGYLLARPARAISIAAIMSAVGEPVEMTRCAVSGLAGCVGNERCLTHGLWRALGDHILEFLGSMSLADVIEPAQTDRKSGAEDVISPAPSQMSAPQGSTPQMSAPQMSTRDEVEQL